jgi:hypothetical protein
MHGEMMGADPAGLAMSALAVCAAAVPDQVCLQVKQHDPTWRESTRLWVGLVGMPSTKKSPIISAAMAPLLHLDNIRSETNARAMQVWEALPRAEQKSTPKPKRPRHAVLDVNVETLQEILKDSPHGIIARHPELTLWFGSMDRYTAAKGADRAFWLQAYDGGSYNVDRIVRGSSLIPNLSIGLLGGIQPEPLRKLIGDSSDDGLIQRFLPVVLRPSKAGLDAPAGGAVSAYNDLVTQLAKLAPPTAGNLSGPRPIGLSPEARLIREAREVKHLSLAGALEQISPKMASHFGKYDGIFARLCLLFHCVEHVGGALPPEISGDVADRVARFMDEYLRPSAVAFYGTVLGMSAGHEDLMGLASYIVSEGLTEVVARDVQRSTRSLRHQTADEARRLCEKLEAFGWLEPIDPRSRSNSPRWRVVPAVHALFADRGKEETERRAAGRFAVAEALAS